MSRTDFLRAAATTALFLMLDGGWGSASVQGAVSATGSIAGRVVDRTTRAPIAQATVSVESLGLGAVTDEQGRYVIADVAVGTHGVRAWRIDYPARIQAGVVVTAGHKTPLDFDLEARPIETEEVQVRASAFSKPADEVTSTYDLDYEEIRRSPGAIGDVSRLVQSLPGVVIANDQRNDIIARGGSPSENLTLLDNLEVPNLNHFASQGASGGPISMLNNEFVRDARFLAGGFPAQYGDRLSSVLDIRLREGNRNRMLGEVDVSLAGAGVLAEGPVGSHGSWSGSVRQSYLDLVAESFGITAVPYTTNAQFKAEYDLGTRDRLWAVGIWGKDDIDIGFDPADREDPNTFDTDWKAWRYAAGFNWQRLFGTRGWGTLAVSDAGSHYGVDARDALLGGVLVLGNHSTESVTTLKYDFSWRFGVPGDLRAGAAVKWFRNELDIAQPFGTENFYSPDTGRVNATIVSRDEVTATYGSYLQWMLPMGERATVTAGGRVDHYDDVTTTRFGPRAGVTVHLTKTLELTGAWGVYHQLPAFVYLDAAPGNRDMIPIRANHYIGGLAWYPWSDLKITAEAYRKDYDAYPVSTEYPTLSLANSGDVYAVYGLLFPMASAGQGRARGIELYLQKKLTRHVYGQISYTWSRVEHAALDGVARRGGFDMPNAATVIVGYKPSPTWAFSTRYSYTTGRPYTPALEPQSTQQDRYILDLARVNTLRSPAYSRLDLRGDYRYRMLGANVTVFLEVQNALDRRNVFQFVWNSKKDALDALDQIRFLPVMGLNVEF